MEVLYAMEAGADFEKNLTRASQTERYNVNHGVKKRQKVAQNRWSKLLKMRFKVRKR